MASLQLVIIVFSSYLSQATILPNLAGDILLTRLESPYDAPGDMVYPLRFDSYYRKWNNITFCTWCTTHSSWNTVSDGKTSFYRKKKGYLFLLGYTGSKNSIY